MAGERAAERPEPPEGFDPEAFVESAPCRFAKTMPHLPHEYVVRGKDVPHDQFEAFVAHIRRHGRLAWWRRRYRNRYLTIGGWRYWAMAGAGTPFVAEQDALPIEDVTIINRERLPRRQ